MSSRVLAVLLLAVVATACGGVQGERDWACANPEHGDYFMEELFATPSAALASVDDEPARYRPTETDAGWYVQRDEDGDVERVVELGSLDGRWGVVSVTSCTGFG